jgi:host factor-I protein
VDETSPFRDPDLRRADSKRISEFYQSYILKLRDDFKILAMGGYDWQDLPATFFGSGQVEHPAQNIQDAFLNRARKDKAFVAIYLMSGTKLSGRITSFDKYSIILETYSLEQLIFKHAIATFVVAKTTHAPAHSGVGTPGPEGPEHERCWRAEFKPFGTWELAGHFSTHLQR